MPVPRGRPDFLADSRPRLTRSASEDFDASASLALRVGVVPPRSIAADHAARPAGQGTQQSNILAAGKPKNGLAYFTAA
jgi:hypothetical protein